MKDGRVAIFEDNPGFCTLLKFHIDDSGNEVVICASTLEEARESIVERVAKLGSFAVDVVLLDGNLGRGMTSNEDGLTIARLIREVAGDEPFIISMSTTGNFIEGADMKMKKDDKDTAEIVNLIKGYIAPHELGEPTGQAA
jgi:DNA-binding response OmpR family regulator